MPTFIVIFPYTDAFFDTFEPKLFDFLLVFLRTLFSLIKPLAQMQITFGNDFTIFHNSFVL